MVFSLQSFRSLTPSKMVFATSQVTLSVRKRIAIRLMRQIHRYDEEARKLCAARQGLLELFIVRIFLQTPFCSCTHLYFQTQSHPNAAYEKCISTPFYPKSISKSKSEGHYHHFDAALVTATAIVTTVTTITITTTNHILHPYCRHRGLSIDNPCASKSLRAAYLSLSPPHREYGGNIADL